MRNRNLIQIFYDALKKVGIYSSYTGQEIIINGHKCQTQYSNLTPNWYWWGVPKDKLLNNIKEKYEFLVLIGGYNEKIEVFIFPMQEYIKIAGKYPLNRGRWLTYISPILHNSQILLFYPRKTSEKINTKSFLNNFESFGITKEKSYKLRDIIK